MSQSELDAAGIVCAASKVEASMYTMAMFGAMLLVAVGAVIVHLV